MGEESKGDAQVPNTPQPQHRRPRRFLYTKQIGGRRKPALRSKTPSENLIYPSGGSIKEPVQFLLCDTFFVSVGVTDGVSS
eukprot:scaffold658_cov415-Pavlova_lutheri.AAC.2